MENKTTNNTIISQWVLQCDLGRKHKYIKGDYLRVIVMKVNLLT